MAAQTSLASPASLPRPPGASIEQVSFSALPGWHEDDHEVVLSVFKRTCAAATVLRAGLTRPADLQRACDIALQMTDSSRAAARRFFERMFVPVRVRPNETAGLGDGFLTGYFEPEFPGSRVKTPEFSVPLYGRPDDLVTIDQGATVAAIPSGFQAARRGADGSLSVYPSRRDIDETSAAVGWPVIAWLRDPVDRFVMQVQGSARLRYADGKVVRIAYSGRNGHPYVSLGRLLSQSENIPPADMTMDRLVARLKGDTDWGKAFIWHNPSFVFFRIADELEPGDGPIGGAGVPLTPHRSLAADRAIWPYGLPVWLDGHIPLQARGQTEPLRRLTVIQDTGSAIVGAARFDLFYGSGEVAGFVAGLTRHAVSATILWPRADGFRLSNP